MKNIVKGPNRDNFLRITFQNDKPPLETQSEQRTN